MATLDASIPLQAGRAVADPGQAVQLGLQTAGSLMKIQEMVQGVQNAKLKNAYAVNKTAAGLAKEALQVYKRAASKGSPMEAEAAMNAYWRDQGKALVDLFGKEQADTMLEGQHTVDDMTQFYTAKGSRAAALGSALGLEKEQGAAARPITPEERAQYGLPADAPYSMTDKGPELIKTPDGGKKPTPQTDLGKLQADYQAGLLAPDNPQENTRLYQVRLGQLLEKDKGGAGGIDPKKLADMTEAQGDNYVQASKDYVTVRDAYKRVQASAQDASPSGDLALIFNFMKMLDPGSVVRESEFQTAAAAGSYGQRIQGLVNQVLNGTRLEDNQRADFVNRSRKLMETAQETQKLTRDNYRKIATRAKVNPDDISDRVVLLALEGQQQALAEQAGSAQGQGLGVRGPEVAQPQVPTPQTMEEFNALPSGELYYDPDDPPGSPPRRKP